MRMRPWAGEYGREERKREWRSEGGKQKAGWGKKKKKMEEERDEAGCS